VSDVGILNDPVSLIAIVLFFGSPGVLLGGILGAIAGFVVWLTGWIIFKVTI